MAKSKIQLETELSSEKDSLEISSNKISQLENQVESLSNTISTLEESIRQYTAEATSEKESLIKTLHETMETKKHVESELVNFQEISKNQAKIIENKTQDISQLEFQLEEQRTSESLFREQASTERSRFESLLSDLTSQKGNFPAKNHKELIF